MRRLALLILLAVLGNPAAWAGSAGLSQSSFRSMRLESAIPGAPVQVLLTDARGRLWAGTGNGLAMFTGVAWRTVAIGPEARSMGIRALLDGADGSLWVGTEWDGLWRLKDELWTSYAGALPGAVLAGRVQSLLETRGAGGRTRLWAGSSRGVAWLEDGIWHSEGAREGLPDAMVWKLAELTEPDGSRRLWAATAGGVVQRVEGRWLQVGQNLPADFHANGLLALEPAPGRREVWVSQWNEGVLRWDGRTWRRFGPRDGFPSHNPTGLALTRDASGRQIVWAGTYDAGLAWYDGTWHGIGAKEGFPSLNVLALEGVAGGRPTILVGTRDAGVQAVDLGGWTSIGPRQGLPDGIATCFAEDPSGPGLAMWIGTSSGLAHWDEASGQVQRLAGLPSTFVQALEPEGRGLWIGTLRGLVRYEGGKGTLLGRERGFPAGSAGHLLKAWEADGSATLWVGLGSGLSWLKNGRWSFQASGEGFADNATTGIAFTLDPEGTSSLWVATRSEGIRRLRAEVWRSYGVEQGLPSPEITCLKQLSDGHGRPWLWAATIHGELAALALDRPGAKWQTLAHQDFDAWPSNPVRGLASDLQGRLYVSTQRGVARITVVAGGDTLMVTRAESYTMGDGLPSQACFGGYRDSKGRIWVGTSQGAAVFDPAQESPAPPLATPSFIRAERGSQPLAEGAVLDHRQHTLFFDFGLPVHPRFEDTLFRTQLVGAEAEPGPWRRASFRELTGLRPGSYTLRVWARNYSGAVSGPAAFSFRVRPAPWRSPWAYAGYGLCLLGLGAAWHGWRTRLLRKRSLDLEQAVTQALAELRTLRGLIPICAYCKKIRDDEGSWEQLERYIGQRSEARFSHSICPECREDLKQELRDLEAP
jgi:ligand-binding sensor domain-containing protein